MNYFDKLINYVDVTVVAKHAIDMLGRTDQEVAATLRHLGIKGDPGLPSACPLANYLNKITGRDDWGVGITTAGTHSKDDSVESEYARKAVSLSRAAVDFRSKFDANEYPDLIERSSRVR